MIIEPTPARIGATLSDKQTMTALPRHTMTADEFMAWDARQPKEAGRFELVDGIVVALGVPVFENGRIVAQSERVEHVEIKGSLEGALRAAIKQGKLPCQAYGDGLTVRVSARKVYKPDGVVRCGTAIQRGTVEITDPVILVEVLSEDSVDRDHGEKLEAYFSLASVHHYLIVDPVRRMMVHHRRGPGEDVLTRVRKTGMLNLDPPGLAIDLATVFQDQP